MRRIGIYGGSFNPPHIGHVRAAEAFLNELSLDLLLVIPSADPPHKTLAADSPSAQVRLELTLLAMSGLPNTRVLDLELRRPGPSYTSDTLRELSAQYPGDRLYLLTGTDMFLSLPEWHEPEVICALAVPVVAARQHSDDNEQLSAAADRLRSLYGCESVLLRNPVTELSSTTLRRMLALSAGRDLLPAGVWERIIQLGAYRTGERLTGLSMEDLIPTALARYKSKRIPHALGCLDTAKQLADRFGADREICARAAILHDVTKALRGSEQLQLCDSYGILITDEERQDPALLHSITGAEAAARVFGESEAVCSAIRWHTTGRPNMTTEEKIVYLADCIEPTRSYPGVEETRAAAARDLDEALLLGMQGTLNDLLSRGIRPSPVTQQAIDALRGERNTL